MDSDSEVPVSGDWRRGTSVVVAADLPPLPRQAAAELIGAFFLTLAGAGMEMLDVLYPGHIDRTMKAAAPASVVAAMIYSIGDISGAHLNPVVTTAFAVRRAFQWRVGPCCLVALPSPFALGWFLSGPAVCPGPCWRGG